jgi:peptide/nickel transport system permease protein
MATVSSSGEQHISPRPRAGGRWKALSLAFVYARRNPALTIGVLLLASLLLFAFVGAELYGTANAAPLSVAVNQAPSAAYPLGTDQQARDMLAVIIAGTPLTLEIGVIAGVIGTVIGTFLAFAAGYYRGFIDTLIRTLVDVGLTVPSLVILIVIAISVHGNLTVTQVGLVVASTAWLWPTRSMRSQVLSLRERTYVQVGRLSGMGGPEIIVREMIPNLIPFIAASLVIAISQAVLASIGLEALGLGSLNSPTLGMTIYWAIYNSALMQGGWWVWAPAIVVIVILFMGLFLVSIGLDSVANPRLRRTA